MVGEGTVQSMVDATQGHLGSISERTGTAGQIKVKAQIWGFWGALEGEITETAVDMKMASWLLVLHFGAVREINGNTFAGIHSFW